MPKKPLTPGQPSKADVPPASSLWDQALTLHRAGHLAQALSMYERFIAKNPKHVDSLYSRAIVLQDLNRLDEARLAYDRVIALRPDFVDAYYNRAVLFQQSGRLPEALAGYDSVIALRPDHAPAFHNRGATLRELGRLEEALASFDRAIAVHPVFFEAHHNRGIVLQGLGRHEEALTSFDRAIAIRPENHVTHDSLAVSLYRLDRDEEALASYDRALALKPSYARAHRNRGDALLRLSRLEEALLAYDRAIAIEPDNPETNWNKGLLQLRRGEFDQGWKAYEWRWRCPRKAFARQFDRPLWLGEQSIAGKTILVSAEQGLGDFIQFCRYVPLVAALGANTVLETPASLLALAATLASNITLVEAGRPPPEFDLHCPIMSLPLAFKTGLETIPATHPYLHADRSKVAAWAAKLGPKTRPRVGLVWCSGYSKDEPEAWRSLLRRNIPLREIAKLNDPDIDFYSLQKGDAAEAEIRLSRHEVWPTPNFTNYADELRDFSDTAALIANLDLVISVDTSVAHLAGALGKPVWILLASSACWRWLVDRTDSPWYPTAKLYRQSRTGGWDDVIDRVRADLATL